MNLRVKAASFILCNGNIEEALELLDNASSVSDDIPDEVVVWDKFEHEPIEAIIEHIDNLEKLLQEAYNEGLNKNKRLNF